MLTLEFGGLTLTYVRPSAIEAQRIRVRSLRLASMLKKLSKSPEEIRAIMDAPDADTQLREMDEQHAHAAALERERAELMLSYVRDMMAADGRVLPEAERVRALLSSEGFVYALADALIPPLPEAEAGESEAPQGI